MAGYDNRTNCEEALSLCSTINPKTEQASRGYVCLRSSDADIRCRAANAADNCEEIHSVIQFWTFYEA
jgi:hypothetical protein